MTEDRKKSGAGPVASADTPEDIAEMIQAAAQEIRRKGPPNYPDPMLPPWKVIPGEPLISLAWRMGSGEDYFVNFCLWFGSLSDDKQRQYEAENPEPEGWERYYNLLSKQLKQTKKSDELE